MAAVILVVISPSCPEEEVYFIKVQLRQLLYHKQGYSAKGYPAKYYGYFRYDLFSLRALGKIQF